MGLVKGDNIFPAYLFGAPVHECRIQTFMVGGTGRIKGFLQDLCHGFPFLFARSAIKRCCPGLNWISSGLTVMPFVLLIIPCIQYIVFLENDRFVIMWKVLGSGLPLVTASAHMSRPRLG